MRSVVKSTPTASHTPSATTMTSPTLNHSGMPGGLSPYSEATGSADLLDDLLGEPTELLAQRIEVEPERWERDAVDAEVGEALDAVGVQGAARGHLDGVRVSPGVFGACAHRVEERPQLFVGRATREEPVAQP